MAVTAFTRSRQGDSIGWFTLKRNGLAGDAVSIFVGGSPSASPPDQTTQTRPPPPRPDRPDQTEERRKEGGVKKESNPRNPPAEQESLTPCSMLTL